MSYSAVARNSHRQVHEERERSHWIYSRLSTIGREEKMIKAKKDFS